MDKLEFNDNVKLKTRDYIHKYMKKFSDLYIRSSADGAGGGGGGGDGDKSFGEVSAAEACKASKGVDGGSAK